MGKICPPWSLWISKCTVGVDQVNVQNPNEVRSGPHTRLLQDRRKYTPAPHAESVSMSGDMIEFVLGGWSCRSGVIHDSVLA